MREGGIPTLQLSQYCWDSPDIVASVLRSDLPSVRTQNIPIFFLLNL